MENKNFDLKNIKINDTVSYNGSDKPFNVKINGEYRDGYVEVTWDNKDKGQEVKIVPITSIGPKLKISKFFNLKWKR